MIAWQRKRHPEDVPTPVAVAVADFCRRAKAPATPATVREALALLDEAEDLLVRALTDHDPTVTPLGPFAVVDMVAFSTDQATAAQRQQTGYYELVREFVRAKPSPAAVVAAPPPQRIVAFPAVEAPKPPKSKAKAKQSKAQAMAERLRPRKRTPGEQDPAREEAPAPVFGTAFLPRRNLPVPRGRFTQLDPTRASFETLLRPETKAQLEALAGQLAHRVALLRALDHGYSGRRGAALTVDDVVAVLERHHLLSAVQNRERGAVLGAVTEAHGALGKAAHALGMRDGELVEMIRSLGLEKEVREVRERFVREALSPRNLGLRLNLLARTRYLVDLDIEARFREALTRDLTELVDGAQGAAPSASERVELIARQHALPAELLRRAFEQLGLLETLFITPRT
jgi:hypothetical protein